MDTESVLNLPRKLGDNLLLRWGRPEDAGAMAEFNIRLHSDNPPEREEWLGIWTKDLMSGIHPTTSAADFTIVEDLYKGAIVSSQVVIPQTWSYEGIPFGVGRPELVGTDEAYRRRGLIRAQMDVAHALCQQQGYFVQAITGIPWYYRMFGYEMALNLGGSRAFFWTRSGNDKVVDEEPYTIRPATTADIPVLDELYQFHCARSLIRHERTEAIWHYHLSGSNRESIAALQAHIISHNNGQVVAYVVFEPDGAAFVVRELGVAERHSWRSVSLFVARELKRRAEELNKERKKPITFINFSLSETHPVYDALGNQVERQRNPYAWYVRVPELPRFINHIGPVLEKRLAKSVVAGYTGLLRLNFYTDTMTLDFKDGALAAIGRYEPANVEDADALFPSLTFLQLLFGHRGLDQLDAAYADCYAAHEEAAVVLKSLFPRKPSGIRPLD